MTFCARGNVMLLIMPSISFLVHSFFNFVVSTIHFPEVEDRYISSIFMTERNYSILSFNLQ